MIVNGTGDCALRMALSWGKSGEDISSIFVFVNQPSAGPLSLHFIQFVVQGVVGMRERRKEERLKILNWVSVSMVSEETQCSERIIPFNYSENISSSGMKIRGSAFLPVGTRVKIDYRMNSGSDKTITVTGKIVWIRMIIENKYYEAGVEFAQLSDETAGKLKDYIQSKIDKKDKAPFKVDLDHK